MKKSFFISICFLYSIFSLHAIDIKLVIDYPMPTDEKFIEAFGEESENRRFTHPLVGWAGKTNLVFGLRPYYFNLDTETGEYSGLSELHGKIGTEYTEMYEFSQNDYLYFTYGANGPFADRYFGLYSLEHGWKEIEREEQVIGRKQGNMPFPPPRERMVHYWENHLFGPYVLVPRPEISDFEELKRMDIQALVSLKNMQTEDLSPLPKEIKSLRNIGNGNMVAVNFDRFRIAIFGNFVQRTPDDPLHFDHRVYILKVIYDGTLSAATSLRAETGTSGEVLAILPANTPLLVTDTAQYEQREDGREDFWYKVSTDTQSGWVFGGDLLIEGDDWKKRLDTRGRPVEWEELDDFLENPNQVQEKDEISIEENLVVEVEKTKDEPEVVVVENTVDEKEQKIANIRKKKNEWKKIFILSGGAIVLAFLLILWDRRRD